MKGEPVKKIKERLVAAFFGEIIDQKVSERLQAASISDGLLGRAEDAGWRRLTGNTERILPSTTFDRQIEIAYWLWKTNPLGRWLIEITTAFICGDGFTIEADNDKLKKFLTEFWEHPVNNFPIYAEKHVRELGIYGCLVLPKFVTQYSGKMAVGFIDPANIRKVVTDPQNVKMIIGVITKGTDMQDGKKFKTALPTEAEDFLSPDAKAWRETCQYECFYFAINNVTNDPYGTSDLFDIADWLDSYEQFLYDYVDKWPLLNTFVWDMIVTGGDKNAIEEQIKNFTKKSGSVFGHNEKVTLTPSTPELKSIDVDKGARLFRNHILGAKSIPEHWYGGAGDVNRATALESGDPAFKMMSKRQLTAKSMFFQICDEAIREADKHGMLNVPADERTYSINTPELASKDITKFAMAIQQLSASLVAAQTQEWIDKDNAVKIFAFCISLIGYELDVEAIKTVLEEEAKTKGYEDYTKKPEEGQK